MIFIGPVDTRHNLAKLTPPPASHSAIIASDSNHGGSRQGQERNPSKEDFNLWYPAIVEIADLVDKKIPNQKYGCLEAIWLEGNDAN